MPSNTPATSAGLLCYGNFVDLISGKTFHVYDPGKSNYMPARCPALEHLIEYQKTQIRLAQIEREKKERAALVPRLGKEPQGRLFK